MPHPTPLPPRDLGWHVAQAALLDVQALAARARRKLHKGDTRAAICYLEALQTQRPNARMALHLAALHRQCRDFPRALGHLRAAQARWPDRTDLLRPLAAIAALAGDHALAAETWERLAGGGDMPLEPVLRAIGCLRQTGAETQAQRLLACHAQLLRARLSEDGFALVATGAAGLGPLPPGLHLITGNNGTGKTQLGQFLQTLGLHVIDADIAIGCYCAQGRYADLAHDLTRHDAEGTTTPRWIWPHARVAALQARIADIPGPVFVVGGHGAMVIEHIDSFAQVFHLHAPTSVIAQRLAQRDSPSHRVGSPGYEAALRRNRRLKTPAYPAIMLRADRPVWKTCADLLQRMQALAEGSEVDRGVRAHG